jgi:hypothetical protein
LESISLVTKHTKPKNILVIATRRIGDVILTTPLIRSLRHAYRDARLDVVVFNGTENCIFANKDIDTIITITEGATFREQIKLFQEASVIIGPHSQPFRDILFSSNALVIQLIQGFRDTSNQYYQWAQNYNYLGSLGENLCLPLFSEIKFHTNSGWIYPEDKFEKDMSQLISLSDRQKAFSYDV